jgi:hypothetical protein
MMLVSCDFHSRYQQMASVDIETGELVERHLEHQNGEARAFYRALPAPTRVGVGHGLPAMVRQIQAELGHELLVGDAA